MTPLIRGQKGFRAITSILAQIEPMDEETEPFFPLADIALVVKRGGATLDMDADNGKYIRIRIIVTDRTLKPSERPVVVSELKRIAFNSPIYEVQFRSGDSIDQIRQNIQHRTNIFKWILLTVGLLCQANGVYREIREKGGVGSNTHNSQ